MIKNIIFDLGNVFVNLDETSTASVLNEIGLEELPEEMNELNLKYEKGLVTSAFFLDTYKLLFPSKKEDELLMLWNAILADFPEERLTFLENNFEGYRIFLLSNTNEFHITYLREQVGEQFYERFYNSFEKVYYSHEIKMSKPDSKIYQFVLDENDLIANETLFVDDKKENTDSAEELGIQVWNINPEVENVIELFEKNSLH